MKHKIVFLILFLSFLSVSQGATQKTANKPPLENVYATSVLISSGTLKTGHAYILASRPFLRVTQNMGDGVLVSINTTFSLGPTTFFLKTKKPFVDNSYLPIPTCAVYTGIKQYTTVLGASATVYAFEEVSCKPYAPKPNQSEPSHWDYEKDKEFLNRLRGLDISQVPLKQQRMIRLLTKDSIIFIHTGKSQAWGSIGDYSDEPERKASLEAAKRDLKLITNHKPSDMTDEKILFLTYVGEYLKYKKEGGEDTFRWAKLDALPDRQDLSLSDWLKPKTKTNNQKWQKVFTNDAGDLLIRLPLITEQDQQHGFWSKVVDPQGKEGLPEYHVVDCKQNKFDGNEIHSNTPAEGVFKFLCSS